MKRSEFKGKPGYELKRVAAGVRRWVATAPTPAAVQASLDIKALPLIDFQRGEPWEPRISPEGVIDVRGNWKNFNALGPQAEVLLHHATSLLNAGQIAREGYSPAKKTYGNTTDGYLYLTSSPWTAGMYGAHASQVHGGEPAYLAFAARKGELLPDLDDWDRYARSRRQELKADGVDIRNPTLEDAFKHLQQVRIPPHLARLVGVKADPLDEWRSLRFPEERTAKGVQPGGQFSLPTPRIVTLPWEPEQYGGYNPLAEQFGEMIRAENPQAVFHGTRSLDFGDFRAAGENPDETINGIYFTGSPSAAAYYYGANDPQPGRIVAAELRYKRLLDIYGEGEEDYEAEERLKRFLVKHLGMKRVKEDPDLGYSLRDSDMAEFLDAHRAGELYNASMGRMQRELLSAAQSAGFDAVRHHDRSGDQFHDSLVVFDPKQIKPIAELRTPRTRSFAAPGATGPVFKDQPGYVLKRVKKGVRRWVSEAEDAGPARQASLPLGPEGATLLSLDTALPFASDPSVPSVTQARARGLSLFSADGYQQAIRQFNWTPDTAGRQANRALESALWQLPEAQRAPFIASLGLRDGSREAVNERAEAMLASARPTLELMLPLMQAGLEAHAPETLSYYPEWLSNIDYRNDYRDGKPIHALNGYYRAGDYPGEETVLGLSPAAFLGVPLGIGEATRRVNPLQHLLMHELVHAYTDGLNDLVGATGRSGDFYQSARTLFSGIRDENAAFYRDERYMVGDTNYQFMHPQAGMPPILRRDIENPIFSRLAYPFTVIKERGRNNGGFGMFHERDEDLFDFLGYEFPAVMTEFALFAPEAIRSLDEHYGTTFAADVNRFWNASVMTEPDEERLEEARSWLANNRRGTSLAVNLLGLDRQASPIPPDDRTVVDDGEDPTLPFIEEEREQEEEREREQRRRAVKEKPVQAQLILPLHLMPKGEEGSDLNWVSGVSGGRALSVDGVPYFVKGNPGMMTSQKKEVYAANEVAVSALARALEMNVPEVYHYGDPVPGYNRRDRNVREDDYRVASRMLLVEGKDGMQTAPTIRDILDHWQEDGRAVRLPGGGEASPFTRRIAPVPSLDDDTLEWFKERYGREPDVETAAFDAGMLAYLAFQTGNVDSSFIGGNRGNSVLMPNGSVWAIDNALSFHAPLVRHKGGMDVRQSGSWTDWQAEMNEDYYREAVDKRLGEHLETIYDLAERSEAAGTYDRYAYESYLSGIAEGEFRLRRFVGRGEMDGLLHTLREGSKHPELYGTEQTGERYLSGIGLPSGVVQYPRRRYDDEDRSYAAPDTLRKKEGGASFAAPSYRDQPGYELRGPRGKRRWMATTPAAPGGSASVRLASESEAIANGNEIIRDQRLRTNIVKALRVFDEQRIHSGDYLADPMITSRVLSTLASFPADAHRPILMRSGLLDAQEADDLVRIATADKSTPAGEKEIARLSAEIYQRNVRAALVTAERDMALMAHSISVNRPGNMVLIGNGMLHVNPNWGDRALFRESGDIELDAGIFTPPADLEMGMVALRHPLGAVAVQHELAHKHAFALGYPSGAQYGASDPSLALYYRDDVLKLMRGLRETPAYAEARKRQGIPNLLDPHIVPDFGRLGYIYSDAVAEAKEHGEYLHPDELPEYLARPDVFQSGAVEAPSVLAEYGRFHPEVLHALDAQFETDLAGAVNRAYATTIVPQREQSYEQTRIDATLAAALAGGQASARLARLPTPPRRTGDTIIERAGRPAEGDVPPRQASVRGPKTGFDASALPQEWQEGWDESSPYPHPLERAEEGWKRLGDGKFTPASLVRRVEGVYGKPPSDKDRRELTYLYAPLLSLGTIDRRVRPGAVPEELILDYQRAFDAARSSEETFWASTGGWEEDRKRAWRFMSREQREALARTPLHDDRDARYEEIMKTLHSGVRPEAQRAAAMLPLLYGIGANGMINDLHPRLRELKYTYNRIAEGQGYYSARPNKIGMAPYSIHALRSQPFPGWEGRMMELTLAHELSHAMEVAHAVQRKMPHSVLTNTNYADSVYRLLQAAEPGKSGLWYSDPADSPDMPGNPFARLNYIRTSGVTLTAKKEIPFHMDQNTPYEKMRSSMSEAHSVLTEMALFAPESLHALDQHYGTTLVNDVNGRWNASMVRKPDPDVVAQRMAWLKEHGGKL